MGRPFRRVAARLGVGIAGSARHDLDRDDEALAARVARSGDGVLIGTRPDGGLIRALRAHRGSRATIMAGDGFINLSAWLGDAGHAARGVYVGYESVAAAGTDGTRAGERFAREFGATRNGAWTLHAAQATEVLLQAIARLDGTRASVLRELRATTVRDGLLGSFRFDRHGDMTPAKITISRVMNRLPDATASLSDLEGTVVDRVVTVPASLAG